ncbi:OmpA family protein [Acinetobacter sp. V91_7]|uniref:OmpA family protein n=1 Tax=unclassified Acinetobacter TaxID=196816 RepID=UPI0018E0C6B4|nr:MULTISPECIES: OmpA family protein [unclassified Acinetobacter]MBI1448421.1 OmpA family protein [Acinetobacter sp. AC1-2]MDS7932991.1 OmpA family protein [Acinetobacter sp. V91_4B]MDS7962946.1 OmpA family protein [Acinetobacter sp. V91_7]MDS8026065.1 OmpA family protein [Acinetobacter sp. V91_13]
MSINPIELLKEKVSSILLDEQDGYLGEKSNALSKFYPILLSLLAAKPDLIGQLKNSLAPSLSDLFSHNDQIKNTVLTHLSGTAPNNEIESTLNSAIKPSLTAISDVAGNDQQSIVNYLRQHADTIRSYLPAWAVGLLAPLGVGAGLSSVPHSTSTAPPLAAASEKTGKSRGFLPIIALIILGLIIAWLWRSCQHKEAVPAPEPSAASGVEAAAAPASLTLSTDDKGAVSQCQAGIGDQGFLATLQTNVKKVFSTTQDCNVDTSQTYAASFTDKDALAGVLGALKGVPNASLEWVGDKITLKAGDAAALEALTAKVKALVPHTEVVAAAPVTAEQSVSNSLSASQTALTAIDPNNVDVNALVKALNLQIINFASGSSEIPADNKAILDQAVTLLNKVSGVKLNVGGHTDSTGNAASNKALSQRRAQAVVDYLTSKGVDASKLVAQGHGSDQPVAENTTDEGRFKNRRIEFSVAQ